MQDFEIQELCKQLSVFAHQNGVDAIFGYKATYALDGVKLQPSRVKTRFSVILPIYVQGRVKVDVADQSDLSCGFSCTGMPRFRTTTAGKRPHRSAAERTLTQPCTHHASDWERRQGMTTV